MLTVNYGTRSTVYFSYIQRNLQIFQQYMLCSCFIADVTVEKQNTVESLELSSEMRLYNFFSVLLNI
jgi:hypothetical protein